MPNRHMPNRHEPPAGGGTERLEDVDFVAAALGDDHQVLARFHPSAGCEIGDAVERGFGRAGSRSPTRRRPLS